MPQVRPARAFLEAALRARQLDRTLTTHLPPLDPLDEQTTGPTSIPALDARLGGGFPRGQLSEIVGARSTGRTSVLLRSIAAATARGELAALIDALDMLDVDSAVVAGVELERLLWVRGRIVPHAGRLSEMNDRAMDQAIKALTLVLQAGNFGLVACDFGEAPLHVLRRLPPTTWLRVQRMVEGTQVVCLIVGDHPMARSTAGLTLQLGVHAQDPSPDSEDEADMGRRRAGPRFGRRMFEGLDVQTRVVRARLRAHEGAAAMVSTVASSHA